MTRLSKKASFSSPHFHKNSLLFFLFFVSRFSGLLYQVFWVGLAFASFGIIQPILSVVIPVFILELPMSSWFGGKTLTSLKKDTKTICASILYVGRDRY
jgi:hypothetical protein